MTRALLLLALLAAAPAAAQVVGPPPPDPALSDAAMLDRRRYVCNATTLQPELQPLAAQDRFHDLLEAQTTRTLYTVAPVTATSARARSYLTGPSLGYAQVATTPATWAPLETGLTLTTFDAANTALKPQHFGLLSTNTARKNAIIDWVRGVGRPNMGDIYHSSPVVVGPPGSGE